MGSGDKNTSHFNLYTDRLRRSEWWAPETPGPNSFSQLSDVMFELRDGTSPCVELAGEPPVRIVGSYQRPDGITVGSDALITIDGFERTMLLREQVRTAAWLIDGAGRRDAVVLHLMRGNAPSVDDSPWLQWPQFSFAITSDATCATLAKAVVQFGPSVRAPAFANRPPEVRSTGFGAYATVYRSEEASLIAKAALFGSIPSPIGAEPDQDLLVACGGGSVSSHDALLNTMAALGNGAWSSRASDPEAHAVEYFLTEPGFPVRLIAGASLDGALVNLCWGAAFATEQQGQPLPRLRLPTVGLTNLDAFHASGIVLGEDERAAGPPTNINRGLDVRRVAAFLLSSENPAAAAVAEQVSAEVERARLGEVQGPFTSWSQARTQLASRVAQVTAAAPIQSLFAPIVAPAIEFVTDIPPGPNGFCHEAEIAASCPNGAVHEPGLDDECPLFCDDGVAPLLLQVADSVEAI